MTILHKCSKTHGRYLVLLVTSWLRLKAEKCDRICWEGLWCRPVAQAADADAGCTGHPEVWAAQLRRASPSPCEGPVHRGLLCGPRQAGGTQLALGHAMGWGGQRAPLLCVLRAWVLPVVWNRSARCPLLEGPARVPLCLSQRPPALDGLGGRDVQGWARKERPTAGSRFCTWVPDDG